MAQRINRAIELLEAGQAIYYTGHHTGHVLTEAQGRADAGTWADYINVGMEHGAFDMAGLAAYLKGLAEGGPTRSGHRMPTVIVEAPVNGIDEANVRFNAWQFRQILARGAHGILLCQAETPGAVRAFVESCRYPHHTIGTDPALPTPLERMRGAEIGPGDLGLAFGDVALRLDPYRPELQEAREKIRAACARNGLAFLEACSPANICARIDQGVRVVAGGNEETARIGRAHQKRAMPV